MKKEEARRHQRIPSAGPVKVRWQGVAGEAHFARGKIVNSSKSGLCVELVEPIKPLSYVTLDTHELTGSDWGSGGSVRHCTVKGTKYVVGVELHTGAGAS